MGRPETKAEGRAMSEERICDWCHEFLAIIPDPLFGVSFCTARCHEQWLDANEATFQLRNDPPAVKRERFDNNNRSQQAVLFAGLDCLPGQEDLFATDGEESTYSTGKG